MPLARGTGAPSLGRSPHSCRRGNGRQADGGRWLSSLPHSLMLRTATAHRSSPRLSAGRPPSSQRAISWPSNRRTATPRSVLSRDPPHRRPGAAVLPARAQECREPPASRQRGREGRRGDEGCLARGSPNQRQPWAENGRRHSGPHQKHPQKDIASYCTTGQPEALPEKPTLFKTTPVLLPTSLPRVGAGMLVTG